MKIGVVQPSYSSQAPADTVDFLLKQVQSAKGNDLVVLPEYSNAPGITSKHELLAFIETQTLRLLEGVRSAARANRSAVAVNALMNENGQHFNTTLFFDRDGKEIFRYRKTHLTASETDDWGISPGGKNEVLTWEGVRLGFLTCFEIYFSEYVERLAALRPDVVIFPTYQRSEDSQIIVKQIAGRAPDLEAFIVRASYSMGESSKTGGHSLVANPSGEIVLDAVQKTGTFSCTIDPREKRPRPINHGLPAARSRQIVEDFRRAALYRPAGSMAADASAPFPRVCAHRGLMGLCPENTLPAFAAAVAMGVEELELDVWESKDGELVVCHNEDVDATSNGKGKICDLTWDEISKLDSGSWFAPDWAGTPFCTLRQFLEQFAGRSVLNIHLKETGKDGLVIRKVADLIDEFQIAKSAYIAGEFGVPEWALKIAPHIERCHIDSPRDGKLVDRALEFQCSRVQFWAPHFKDEHIAKAKKNGIICNLFESNDAEDSRQLLDRGIDVILTNFANRILPVTRSRAKYSLTKNGTKV